MTRAAERDESSLAKVSLLSPLPHPLPRRGTRLKALGSSSVARVRSRGRCSHGEARGTLVCSAPAAYVRVRGRWSPNPIVTHVRASTDPARRVYTMTPPFLVPLRILPSNRSIEGGFASNPPRWISMRRVSCGTWLSFHFLQLLVNLFNSRMTNVYILWRSFFGYLINRLKGEDWKVFEVHFSVCSLMCLTKHIYLSLSGYKEHYRIVYKCSLYSSFSLFRKLYEVTSEAWKSFASFDTFQYISRFHSYNFWWLQFSRYIQTPHYLTVGWTLHSDCGQSWSGTCHRVFFRSFRGSN